MEEITIATLGSHSALQILKGAKDEGFKTALVCLQKRLKLYNRFKKLIDELIIVNNFSEIASPEVQEKLLNLNSILIPHGSLIEYVSLETIEKEFKVPIFGNKYILRWESDRVLKEKLLHEAGVRTPKMYSSIDEIDRTVIIKLPGAKGGKGYFLASGSEDAKNKIRELGLKMEDIFIQEYVLGVTAYSFLLFSIN
jgi:5-formaminoimidazole-4-carboxamide-1-(beta)-D-ribofuranosyl 5'-monophosphate synthetase